MRSLFIILGILSVVAFAELSLSDLLNFLPEKNLTDADSKFTYRYSSTQSIELPSASDILGWVSASVDASSASSEAKVNANAMVGIGALPTLFYTPFALLGYGIGSGAVDVNVVSFLTLMLSKGKLDANFNTGVIGLTVLNIQEFDPDEKPVGLCYPFKSSDFLPCVSEKIVNDDGNLTGLSCSFTVFGTTANAKVTYVTSKKAGILKYANTPVSPRSLEMIIEVNNFPLTDSKNHIRLNLGLLTASGAGTVKGTAEYVHRPFVEDLYAATANYGIVDNRTVELEVNLHAASVELQSTADVVFKTALGADFDTQVASINFPAGARSFIYDPAVGAGMNVYHGVESPASSSGNSGASSTTPGSSTTSKSGSAQTSSTHAGSNGASTVTLSLFVALISALLILF